MLIPWKVDVYMERYGLVNYGLLALLLIVYLACPPGSEPWMEWAGIEMQTDWQGRPLSFELTTEEHSLLVLSVSATLLHAGFLHLLGNCLFLWVFGNSVNCKIGHLPYVGLYLLCAMAGSMAHYGFDGGPAVGASGAIYGIMGAFLILYPRNDIYALFWMPFTVLLRPVRFSSIWAIVLWVGWDAAWMISGAETNVALWGHIGGFLAGFVVMMAAVLAGWVRPTSDEQFLPELVGLKERT
ncbi:MAG: rhomboid family intramembrane serine protease [Phycisphaerae bacterium]